MSETIPPQMVAQLIRCTAILSWSAARQEQWLRSLGLGADVQVVDELALELSWACESMDQMVARGWLDKDVAMAIKGVDDFLDDLSGDENGEFWSVGALYSDARWDEVRDRCVQALIEMSREKP